MTWQMLAIGRNLKLKRKLMLIILPIPVAARSKALVCGRSLVGIAGSNPTAGMDVCLL
jgi:hypothetical protein